MMEITIWKSLITGACEKKGQLEISLQQCRLMKRKVGPSMQVPACGLGGARDWPGVMYPPAEFWTAFAQAAESLLATPRYLGPCSV